MEPRYRAFLSYSHRDSRLAAWLHRKLESYRVPAKLVGTTTSAGSVPRRLRPIFRDREELSASSDLSAAIQVALQASPFLIVICSPAAAASRWVNEEVLAFKRLHGEGRILPVIVSGEPNVKPDHDPQQECFPEAIRWRIGPDGRLSTEAAEVVAADLRSNGDGRRLATLKLVSGLTGLPLDELVQRETQRRLQRFAALAAGASAGMVLTGGLAIYANERRIEAVEQRRIAEEQRQIAERESATAKAAADYLVGTFALANPGSEDPEAITALTILQRGAERARTELAGQPVVHARLLDTLGLAYLNLGLFEEGREALTQSTSVLDAAGPEGASAKLTLALAHLSLGSIDEALAVARQADLSLSKQAERYRDVKARAAIVEGTIRTAAGDTQEGIAAYDRALALYEMEPRTGPVKVADAHVNRGLLLSDNGQFTEAEMALQTALDLYRAALGERHRATGQTWFALAQNAFLSGDLGLAASRIEKALAIERQMLKADNPIIADSLSLQGQIYYGQNRFSDGERSLREAIAIYRKAYDGPHYLIGIAQVYLALIRSARGETLAALRTLDDAKANYDGSYRRVHANHGDLLVNRATILAKAGRKREAQRDCAAGLEILNRTLGREAAYTRSMAATCNRL